MSQKDKQPFWNLSYSYDFNLIGIKSSSLNFSIGAASVSLSVPKKASFQIIRLKTKEFGLLKTFFVYFPQYFHMNIISPPLSIWAKCEIKQYLLRVRSITWHDDFEPTIRIKIRTKLMSTNWPLCAIQCKNKQKSSKMQRKIKQN